MVVFSMTHAIPTKNQLQLPRPFARSGNSKGVADVFAARPVAASRAYSSKCSGTVGA